MRIRLAGTLIVHAVRAMILFGTVMASSTPVLAHGGEDITERTALSVWHFTPDIVIPTVLIAAVYLAGAIRRRTSNATTPWWRQAMFFAGLASVFLALQSPIDPIGERLFFVHQIQHLLLRMLGPMLLALSWPQGLLTVGLPAVVKGRVLAPMLTNSAIRQTFRFVAHPAVTTVLFILALYFWEIPQYHNLALLNELVHYFMHVTMLLAGLLFWWQVFDRRSPISATAPEETWRHPLRRRSASHGVGYGAKLMMLWVVILSNILLGSYTALKTTVLYDAYDILGRLYGYSPLTDERIGGIIIWIPSSMMCLIAVLIVIHRWGLHEIRMDERRNALPTSNSATLIHPATGAAMIEHARPKNRAMAAGFGMFIFTVFATAILVGVLYNVSGRSGDKIEARDALVRHAAHDIRHPSLR